MSTAVVKRYSNRKLYDTERSVYITLTEVYNDVRDGRDFRVVDVSDNKQRDITTQILLRAIIENEMHLKLSREFLVSVIKTGAGLQ